jgi:hypothetical protein
LLFPFGNGFGGAGLEDAGGFPFAFDFALGVGAGLFPPLPFFELKFCLLLGIGKYRASPDSRCCGGECGLFQTPLSPETEKFDENKSVGVEVVVTP